VTEFTLDVPVIIEDGIHVDYGEQQIDVSRDPNRFIPDPSSPFYVPGTRPTFIVPFTGDGNLFGVQPQQFRYSLGRSRAELVKGEIHFTFTGANLDGNTARREFDSEMTLVKENLATLKTAIDRHNTELPDRIRNEIKQRKTKLLADAQIAAGVGFPIKKREGTPTTYAVPVQKRRPRIELPPASSSAFAPEPVLALAEYDDILGIIRNMVRVMEQSPKSIRENGRRRSKDPLLGPVKRAI
jgi:hypothetical protein